MAKLKKEHKVLIVGSLAENNSGKEVQNLLREHFDLNIPLNQISFYNPEIASSSQLSDTWRSLYWQKKEAYRKDLTSHPTTDKAYRIGMLEKAAHKYMEGGQYLAMAKVLEQIAKETGGYFDEMDGTEGGGEGDSYTSIQVFMQQINNKIDQAQEREKKKGDGSKEIKQK